MYEYEKDEMLREAVEIFKAYLEYAPAFTCKPIGAPNSIMRERQDGHIATEEKAKEFVKYFEGRK